MKNLLEQPQNVFFHEYEILVVAGKKVGVGVKSIEPVRKGMGNPLKTKSITLSCGKLTTGVTVKPWGGLFMLRNTTSPETYFQTALEFNLLGLFQVQTKIHRTNKKYLKRMLCV